MNQVAKLVFCVREFYALPANLKRYIVGTTSKEKSGGAQMLNFIQHPTRCATYLLNISKRVPSCSVRFGVYITGMLVSVVSTITA